MRPLLPLNQHRGMIWIIALAAGILCGMLVALAIADRMTRATEVVRDAGVSDL